MSFTITLSVNGSNHLASFNGAAPFIVGRRTTYLGNTGLMNLRNMGAVFTPEAYESSLGWWANFIAPTAKAESGGSLTVLNTYDRAKFTFSFMQYAAHVPNGDFVLFFRKLLQLPAAASYFPDLSLSNGRIARRTGNTTVPLESSTSTQALMDYLNPTLSAIEPAEIINAAKFIHWAVNDPAHRQLQITSAVEHFKKQMPLYDKRYNMNGMSDRVCLVVCDIRHQGRAKSDVIVKALNTGGDNEKALNNLLAIGAVKFKTRIDTLTAEMKRLTDAGKLGKRLWSRAAGDFV
ncbi:MAG: hypothetical protein MUC87_05805 [Bacteroidia bacterium]|jgi:hypothetical protein|nr:hypothetical protein [Bacteroidia bacterium]